MKHALIALFLFYSFPDFAGCEKNVTKLNTGAASPCTGWLVSEEQMQDFAKADDKLQLEQKLNAVNKHLISLTETEVEFYKQRSKSQVKELDKEESRRFWSNIGYFGLGVVLTGIAAKAAIEASK